MKKIYNTFRQMLFVASMLLVAITVQAQSLSTVTIEGAEQMTFGPDTDTPYSNAYSVTIKDSQGTTLTEDNISEDITDFKIVWDIEGFKTANDTEGQYCDSYGAFSVNGEGKTKTTFELRDVPMNFYGKMTASVTYNGKTVKAVKYVVALGNKQQSATHVLPLPGYPVDFSAYADELMGYKVTQQTYGKNNDLIVGGWCIAGSDSHTGTLMKDADGTKYVRVTAANMKKSHVMTQTIDAPTAQLIFSTKVRFNSAGGVITLTGGYPFWSASRYTCPVSLAFDGSSITLNNTALTNNDTKAVFTTKTWYQVVLSADKSSETCYALVYDAQGTLVGQSGVLAWNESSSPTYFSVGMSNSSNSGSIDLASCEAFQPTIDADSYTLTADKVTLSIPQGESARLSASVNDSHGYAITQQATWSVVEEDMQESVVITPDADDSHKATITLAPTAEAGTATVQVSIAGAAKTLAISLTSSAESIKFTQSTTSITIPLDDSETATASFAAIVVDGEGNDIGSTVTLAAYDKDGINAFTSAEGISFDATTGLLSVTAFAQPTQLTIRATGHNKSGNELTKSVKVNIHGMKFDFGYTTDEAAADGFTVVGASTAYSAANGYGIVSGSATESGNASATDADADYLQGALQFNFKVQKGNFYTVEITYQGKLTTGYVNSDLTGYDLGSHTTMATESYTLPATLDVADLHIADADATSVARISKIVITKQAKRQKRNKPAVHHIGDSTSANNGSWAYRLSKIAESTYPELTALCDFKNNGAGGRNLCTYYAQGKLYGVLLDIYPDDILMFGNNGTNGMGNSYEADMNYYLNAAEALGAKIIINSYTPHGAVSNYASGYNSTTNTFKSYRTDSYETIVRRVASRRAKNDENYLGFVEIGKNADAIFNAYTADYAANGYATANDAAQAIIKCFTDHNHYSNGTLACDLMLNGYPTADVQGIVAQLVGLLTQQTTGVAPISATDKTADDEAVYTLSGQRVSTVNRPGLYIKGGRKVVIK